MVPIFYGVIGTPPPRPSRLTPRAVHEPRQRQTQEVVVACRQLTGLAAAEAY